MQDDIRAPTLAHDLRVLADLYVDVVRLMARRLRGKSGWDRSQFYGPIAIIRPNEEDPPEFVSVPDSEPRDSSLRSE